MPPHFFTSLFLLGPINLHSVTYTIHKWMIQLELCLCSTDFLTSAAAAASSPTAASPAASASTASNRAVVQSRGTVVQSPQACLRSLPNPTGLHLPRSICMARPATRRAGDVPVWPRVECGRSSTSQCAQAVAVALRHCRPTTNPEQGRRPGLSRPGSHQGATAATAATAAPSPTAASPAASASTATNRAAAAIVFAAAPVDSSTQSCVQERITTDQRQDIGR